MTLYKHICENCNQEYENAKKESKYCSQNCYKDYRKKNAKLVNFTCNHCNKIYQPRNSNQKYCSEKCRHEASKRRFSYTCENCGKNSTKPLSEMKGKSHYFCSTRCMYDFYSLSEIEQKIIIDNYGEKTCKEIAEIIGNNVTAGRVSHYVCKLGLSKKRLWTEEEVELLKNNYSTAPMDELINLFDGRTKNSLISMSTKYNLLSYNYLKAIYTEEENDFLRENYLKYNNEELAEMMDRSIGGISQHLCDIGLYRPRKRAIYSTLKDCVRANINDICNRHKAEKNYKCELTGKGGNVVLHHIKSFSILFNECVEIMNMPDYDNFEDYKENDIDNFVKLFIEKQEEYKEYIVILSDIHLDFHKKYGFGYNTREQWDDYVRKYIA